MPVTVLLLAQAQPEKADKLKAYIAKCLPETRSYDGCINIDIYEEINKKGAFVFYENWENINAYESYTRIPGKPRCYGGNRLYVNKSTRNNLLQKSRDLDYSSFSTTKSKNTLSLLDRSLLRNG